ncbi:MAG: GWxTD domain-containing protein [Bacteroidota bacterium]
MRNLLLYIVLLAFILPGCASQRNISSNNLAFLYRKNEADLHPAFLVYHEKDSAPRVYFRIATKELLYERSDPNAQEGIARIRFKYQLYPAYESRDLVDSASVIITDTEGALNDKEIIGSFTVKLPPKASYLMGIRTTDMVSGNSVVNYLKIDKLDQNDRENFLVRSVATGQPVFTYHFQVDQEFLVTCNRPWKRLYGKYYDREFAIAPAPFALYAAPPFDYDADSLFQLQPGDTNSVVFKLPSQGLFHLSLDSATRKGVSLFHFHQQFPKANTSERLIEPLRYLTTRNEYDALASAESAKQALDDFWLKNANSPERAKALIRSFYNRVQSANEFFSSHVEGWKTDRGLIYIVFGPPNIIYKSTNSEVWIYGEENNYMSLNVNFIRVDNPFSANDFRLNRSPIYKNNWFRAVDGWREGRIITHQ